MATDADVLDLDWSIDEEPEVALQRAREEDLDFRLDQTIEEQARGDETRALQIAQAMSTKHRLCEGRLAVIGQFADAERARIEQWEAEQRARYDAMIAALEDQLHIWAETMGEKTVDLPDGTLRRRARRSTVEWDELAAHAYQVKHYPEDTKLSKSDLKKRLEKQGDGTWVDTNTGEVVEFIRTVEREGETFSVSHK